MNTPNKDPIQQALTRLTNAVAESNAHSGSHWFLHTSKNGHHVYGEAAQRDSGEDDSMGFSMSSFVATFPDHRFADLALLLHDLKSVILTILQAGMIADAGSQTETAALYIAEDINASPTFEERQKALHD
jgi:hypothetical protein